MATKPTISNEDVLQIACASWLSGANEGQMMYIDIRAHFIITEYQDAICRKLFHQMQVSEAVSNRKIIT